MDTPRKTADATRAAAARALLDHLTAAGLTRTDAINTLAQAWHYGWQAGWSDASDGGLSTDPFPDVQLPA